MRSYEDLDARNGMNRAPTSSRDLTARSFEIQLMGRVLENRALDRVFQNRYKKFPFQEINTLNQLLSSKRKEPHLGVSADQQISREIPYFNSLFSNSPGNSISIENFFDFFCL
jgi:hypothetical protein